jgi:acyl-coenzyme A synthetase/AMP-(fatty) acid ligase
MFGKPQEESDFWLASSDGAPLLTYGRLLKDIESPSQELALGDGLRATLTTIIRALVNGQDLTCVDGVATVVGPPRINQGNYSGDTSAATFVPSKVLASRICKNQNTRVTFQTSGTSGPPKCFTHTMDALRRAVVTGARYSGDVWGLAYPPTTMAGFQVCLQAFCNGNGVVGLIGASREQVLQRCRHWGINRLSATPTFYRTLLPVRPPVAGMRSLTLGGEVADRALLQRLREAFPSARLRNIYALTEAGTVLRGESEEFSVPPEMEDKVMIKDGRVWLSRLLVAEDWQTGDWFDTGDRVEVTNRTPLRFRLLGREGAVINVGGSKVSPEEVERVLLMYDGIAAARVTGRRNSVTGNVLMAEIVWQGRAESEENLREFLQSRLPPERVPRIICTVERLAATVSGKVLRHE